MTKCLSFGVNDNDEIDVSKGDNPCGNNCDDLRDKEKRKQRKKKTKQRKKKTKKKEDKTRNKQNKNKNKNKNRF